ncbi:Inositol phosphorylceramide synthase regulatory subunit KEI1 [Nakaseomyces glabratus]|nr:Inositol phosphorylceramide synthase regulatory subunit KEI1 [Nakaseomyces glabratus]KTB25010.1 Inositol phosphorylceramide synthase regulatory subunit KEI1 [Nakaseomyces glabratus]
MRLNKISFPKSFFGFLPLYLGVEIVLGITILNKCSGAYGILALFTGHPLDYMQWISYLWSVFTLIVFSQGLFMIHKPKLIVFSQILVYFTADTVLTCFFTLWFSAQWFQSANEEKHETSAPVGVSQNYRRSTDLASQGASERYEYTVTMLFTLVTLMFRMYFNFILASFVQELLRHPKYMVDQDDVEQDLKNKSAIKRWWIKSQKFYYKLCRHTLQ